MKLRATVSDSNALRDFMNIGVGITKLSKHCILQITSKKVFFIATEDEAGTTQPYIWCALPVDYYFREFQLEGITEEHNEIFLEFASEHFAQALATLKQNGKLLKIKLANKQMQCLSFIIEQWSEGGAMSRECVHDIPIEVISRKHWSDYKQPQYIDFHVSVHLPNLKSIKKIVDRMKNVSHSLIVMANKAGRLTLKVQSNTVAISADFTDLMIESFDVGTLITMMDETQSDFVTATIDARKFLHFLTGMQLTSCRTKCSIVQSQMVKLQIEQTNAASVECYLMKYTA